MRKIVGELGFRYKNETIVLCPPTTTCYHSTIHSLTAETTSTKIKCQYCVHRQDLGQFSWIDKSGKGRWKVPNG